MSAYRREVVCRVLAAALMIALCVCDRVIAGEPDASLTVTYSPHAANPSCHVNLGPTGAAAWMRGYHFVVMSIQQQSPGHGKLHLGDVIIGTDSTAFGPDHDPRMTLGNAIGEAEASGEPLRLTVLRNGVKQTIEVTLPKLGAYASGWPANCAKSAAILESACQALLHDQLPSGNVPTDGSFGLYNTGLLFLATDDARYLDPARRAVYLAAASEYNAGYNNWAMGYGGVLMAEYYLKTGDDSVLERLQYVADKLAEGQMICGSWGHKSPAGGYGALNQPGLLCAMTLVLARECGLNVDDEAHDKALHFFGRYAGTGAVPYGDHRPGRNMDDNGKSSMAAVLFHLAGDETKKKLFADTVADSYWMREQGHTGGYFSIMWGPLGVAMTGDDAKLQAFLQYQQWYYNLSRKWTGDQIILPYAEALTRFDGTSYIEFGGPFSTAGLALMYAMPTKSLRIFGAPPSVFGNRAKLTGDLKEARALYLARDWKRCDQLLAKISPSKLASDDERYWLKQMVDARALTKRATDRVLAEIACNLQEGGAYWALKQFEALKRAVGEDADPRFAKLEARFEEGTIAWYVREGEKFHDRWEQINNATWVTWTPQGQLAADIMEGTPSARLPYWEPLSPASDLEPQRWKSKLFEPGQTPPAGWYQPGFDDSDWTAGDGIPTRFTIAGGNGPNGPIAARRVFTIDDTRGDRLRVRLRTVRAVRVTGGQLNTNTKVYLNGKLIVDAERGQRGGYAKIPLADGVLGLLKKGENVLAVTSEVQGQGNNHLDVSLEINRSGFHPRHLPIDRAAHAPTSNLPDAETKLTVAESTREYAAALRDRYEAMPVKQLLDELGSANHYYRALAETALINHGHDAVKQALALHDSPDWRVRASVLDMMQKAMKQYAADKNSAGVKLLSEYVPAVMNRLEDDHLWVRTQACETIALFGDDAGVAIPSLIKATNDPDEWVRQSAFAALAKVGADDAAMRTAAKQAVERPNSSFGVPRKAFDIAKMPGGSDEINLSILVGILSNPPEGGGGAMLGDAIAMACKIDTEGKVMVPLLIRIASNELDYSRQRGNPRGAAIEALGNYGKKASAAVDTLKAILKDDSKTGTQQHEAAQAALDAIAS